MKIDKLLLTDKEINNIEIRNKAYEIISKRIDEESEKIREEEFSKFNKDEDELDRSYLMMHNLKCVYLNYEHAFIMIIFGLGCTFFAPYTALSNADTLSNIDNLTVYICTFIAGIMSLIWSIKGLIIRHKIKNNFKKYNILNDF